MFSNIQQHSSLLFYLPQMHMNTAIKKFLVMMPVIVLGIFYLHDHYSAFTRHLGAGRVMLMWLSFFLLYTWILVETLRKQQKTIMYAGIQASFFVYIFMVLTLTGYFI